MVDAEKIKKIREAEERAAGLLDDYRLEAEGIVARAREDADRLIAREEEAVRERSEKEAAAIIELAGTEALELRQEYMFDVHYLEALVARKRASAVQFLVDKLLEQA